MTQGMGVSTSDPSSLPPLVEERGKTRSTTTGVEAKGSSASGERDGGGERSALVAALVERVPELGDIEQTVAASAPEGEGEEADDSDADEDEQSEDDEGGGEGMMDLANAPIQLVIAFLQQQGLPTDGTEEEQRARFVEHVMQMPGFGLNDPGDDDEDA